MTNFGNQHLGKRAESIINYEPHMCQATWLGEQLQCQEEHGNTDLVADDSHVT